MTQIVYAALRVLNPGGTELPNPLAHEIERARRMAANDRDGPCAPGVGGPAEPGR